MISDIILYKYTLEPILRKIYDATYTKLGSKTQLSPIIKKKQTQKPKLIDRKHKNVIELIATGSRTHISPKF